MTNGEAINWIINISADIGKTEHRDLWHYEQALSEIKEMLESEQSKENCCVHINDIYRLISGHSNYHGDNILAALTCLAEGKEVPNRIMTLDAQPERDIPLDCITDEGENAICPKCGANAEWHKYCGECGQALRWKE